MSGESHLRTGEGQFVGGNTKKGPRQAISRGRTRARGQRKGIIIYPDGDAQSSALGGVRIHVCGGQFPRQRGCASLHPGGQIRRAHGVHLRVELSEIIGDQANKKQDPRKRTSG